MMNKLAAFIFAFLICATTIFEACAGNYVVEQYGVYMVVDRNKTAYITEVIDVNFTELAHGIYRDIKLKNATVSDVKVSEQFQQRHINNNLNIKIGNPNEYVAGQHRYTISYKYNYYDNKNEFYHNIIGTEWESEIRKVNFVVTLPAPTDASEVGISIGKYGTAGFDGDAIFKVEDNIVSGTTLRTLSPHEGITLRIEVPAGYFVSTNKDFVQIAIAGMLLLTLIAFLTWYLYGKDEPEIPVVNFYPPEKLNAIETEMAFKGKASSKGIVALLLELAQKGYIQIARRGGDWIINKLKDATDLDRNQINLMTALFANPSTEKIALSQLEKSSVFYVDCQDIIKNVNGKRYKIFYASSIGWKLQSLMFACLIGLLLLVGLSIFNFQISLLKQNFSLLLFPLIAIAVLIAALKKPMHMILQIIWAIGFGFFPLQELITQYATSANMKTIFFGIACMTIAGICTYQLPKRNIRGQKYLNHLLGLKHFIEVAEKPRLQQLVEQNPEYFYNILPAAYVLGVSDKWIKQFEGIMTIRPQWYIGRGFTSHSFNNFADSISKATLPSVANGGISRSSGRGGFVGGGGGGGGGGSW